MSERDGKIERVIERDSDRALAGLDGLFSKLLWLPDCPDSSSLEAINVC